MRNNKTEFEMMKHIISQNSLIAFMLGDTKDKEHYFKEYKENELKFLNITDKNSKANKK